MKKIRFICLMLALLTMCGGCSPVSNRSKRLEYENQIDKALLSHNFEGTVLIADDEGIIYEKAFGYTDDTKETELTTTKVYEVGSLTMQFTAAAVLKLEADGLLTLDDMLSKYFPEIKWAYEFSVRDLLNMNTRIPDYKKNVDFTQITAKEALTEQILSYTMGNELTGYSNSNYYLLGIVIEQVTGMSYEEYITDSFLNPLGLSRTEITDDYTNFATGTFSSNAYDMYHWNMAYHAGEVIPEKYLSELSEQEQAYMYGLYCESGVYYHEGQINNNSSYMKYNEEKGVYVILLSNEMNQAISYYGNDIYEITMEYVG